MSTIKCKNEVRGLSKPQDDNYDLLFDNKHEEGGINRICNVSVHSA